MSSSTDELTRYTARDCLSCKYYATKLGYFPPDVYVDILHKCINKSNDDLTFKKSPIINRGYFARVESIRLLFNEFSQHNMEYVEKFDEMKATNENSIPIVNPIKQQLLLLGCGYDSFALNYYQNILNSDSSISMTTFEVDFEEIIDKKNQIYNTNSEISNLCKRLTTAYIPNKVDANPSHGIHRFGPLSLLNCDIRDSNNLIAKLILAGFDPSLPTFIITECVLIYLPKTETLNLCQSIANLCPNSVWVTYDMINPFDAFGKVMINNLSGRGFKIPGIIDFPALEAQRNRFLETGWNQAISTTMLNMFHKLLQPSYQQKLNAIERLDEIEEWELLMNHYSISIAIQGHIILNICNNF